jgi:hypothetical protein
MIIAAAILILISAVFEAVMDFLQFRLPNLSNHKWSYNDFWDPRYSWRNKWQYVYDIKVGEKFPLSSTVLVFLTDGWHLMKWCRNRCLDVAMFLVVVGVTDFWVAFCFTLAIRSAYGTIFEIVFRKLK